MTGRNSTIKKCSSIFNTYVLIENLLDCPIQHLWNFPNRNLKLSQNSFQTVLILSEKKVKENFQIQQPEMA